MVESPIFDCGAILDPYLVTHAAMDSEQGRSPVMCVQCAAYLSSYATINKATGEWSCCLCAAINPRFHQDYQTMHLVSRSADFVPTTNSIQHGGNCPGNSNDLRELQLRSMYAELRGPHCTFTEDEETTLHYQGTSISAVSTELFGGIAIFAIDADLLNEKHVVSLLCEGIMHLSDFCEVSILLYGRHISGLRLGTGVLSQANPISADIFPGIADKSCLFAHLVQRRAYSIRAESLKGHLDALRSCLTNLATVTITAPHLANTAECAVDAIVDLAVALIASHRSPAASSAAERGRAGNLIFFSSRVLNCRGGGGRNAHISGTPTTENLLGQSLETFSALGKWALSKHCHLDVLHATLRGSNLDQLDALVGPSGGSVVSGNSFEEEHVRTSLLQLVARVSRNDTAQGTGAAFGSGVGIGNICYSRLPTLEIRTCGKLAVDRIVGPILAPDNVVHHNALASMGASVKDKGVPKIVRSADDVSELTYPAAELALDSAHLAHSLHFQEMQAGSFVAPTDSSRIREALYEQLVKLNQLNVVISGINLRRLTANAPHGAQDCITVQFKQNTDEGRDRVKTNSPYSKGNMFIGTVADSAEEREKERIRAHQLQDDAAYVQFVVRYWEYTAAGNNVVGGGSGKCFEMFAQQSYIHTFRFS